MPVQKASEVSMPSAKRHLDELAEASPSAARAFHFCHPGSSHDAPLVRARRHRFAGLQRAPPYGGAPREDEGLRREGLDDLPAGLCERAPARGRGAHARGRRRPGARALGQRAAQARPARQRQSCGGVAPRGARSVPDAARRRHGPDPRGLPDGRGARPRARRARRVRHDRVVEEKRTLPRNRPQVLHALRAPLLQPLREPAHARALRHARPGHGGQRHGAARRPRRRRARSRRETDARERARNDARRQRDARETTRKRRSSTRAK